MAKCKKDKVFCVHLTDQEVKALKTLSVVLDIPRGKLMRELMWKHIRELPPIDMAKYSHYMEKLNQNS